MESFVKKIGKTLNRNKISTVQLNIGYTCNLGCRHCHVEAGVNRTEQMNLLVMKDCRNFIDNAKAEIVDITGGAPELNPNLVSLIKMVREVSTVKKIIVRSNLTLLAQEKYKHLIEIFMANKVELVASLPCYTEENVDFQRGHGVFKQVIPVIKKLNRLGYGTGKYVLNLVYNPGGAFLPGAQSDLEVAYKEHLFTHFNIRFDQLFTITNAPIGRYAQDLKDNGQLKPYQQLLVDNYNKDNLQKLMCLSQVNIDWQGHIFDCDFNQAIKLPIANKAIYIGSITPAEILKMKIEIGDHCYCCTAGAGSSCTGSLDYNKDNLHEKAAV